MIYYKNYPMKASHNAREGYILNLSKRSCKNATGVRTAIKLINRDPVSEKFLKHIHAYLERARVYVGDKDKCGYISYQLWGGEAMRIYCKKILN